MERDRSFDNEHRKNSKESKKRIQKRRQGKGLFLKGSSKIWLRTRSRVRKKLLGR